MNTQVLAPLWSALSQMFLVLLPHYQKQKYLISTHNSPLNLLLFCSDNALNLSPQPCAGPQPRVCCFLCRQRPRLTLLMSMVSKASCRSLSRRSRLLSEAEATPPLPVFPPGRCWKSMMGTSVLQLLMEKERVWKNGEKQREWSPTLFISWSWQHYLDLSVWAQDKHDKPCPGTPHMMQFQMEQVSYHQLSKLSRSKMI